MKRVAVNLLLCVLLVSLLFLLAGCMPSSIPSDFSVRFESAACKGNVGVNSLSLNHAGDLVRLQQGFGLSRDTYKLTDAEVLSVYQSAWKNNLLKNQSTASGKGLCGSITVRAINKTTQVILRGQETEQTLNFIQLLASMANREPVLSETPVLS